jgi:hypothetical protein
MRTVYCGIRSLRRMLIPVCICPDRFRTSRYKGPTRHCPIRIRNSLHRLSPKRKEEVAEAARPINFGGMTRRLLLSSCIHSYRRSSLWCCSCFLRPSLIHPPPTRVVHRSFYWHGVRANGADDDGARCVAVRGTSSSKYYTHRHSTVRLKQPCESSRSRRRIMDMFVGLFG